MRYWLMIVTSVAVGSVIGMAFESTILVFGLSAIAGLAVAVVFGFTPRIRR